MEKVRQEGRQEERQTILAQSVLGLYRNGVSISIITLSLNITEKEVLEIIKNNKT